MKRKRILGLLLTTALVFTLLPTAALASTTTRYIDKNGDQQSSDASPIDGATETLSGGWYVVSGTVTRTGTITVSGEVHLILADDSSLTVTGSQNDAGINVSGGSLTIYGQTKGNGRLTATGGDYGAGLGSGKDAANGGTVTIVGGMVTATGVSGGAGIGGGLGSDGGTAAIRGGTVTATGAGGGAGLGGGYNGDGGIVTIEGGTVMATGAGGGAGLGGGYNGDGGTASIRGGSVNASSITGTPLTEGGVNVYITTVTLASGSGAAAGDAAVVQMGINESYTYGIKDMRTDADGKLYLYLPEDTLTTAAQTTDGAATPVYAVYRGSVKTKIDGSASGTLSVGGPPQQNINVGGKASFTAATLGFRQLSIARIATANAAVATVQLNNGSVTVSGVSRGETSVTVTYSNGLTEFVPVAVYTTDLVVTTANPLGYSYDPSGVFLFTEPGSYTVSMKSGVSTTSANKIQIDGGTSDEPIVITLNNAKIQNGYCAFDIKNTSYVNLNLRADTINTMSSGGQYPGIRCQSGATLVINGSGALNTTGSVYCAGIGSGLGTPAGSIVINGGVITTAGGSYGGAGIGGGRESAGGNVTINGGRITATGGDGAGIGGGYNGNGGNIIINGGAVNATGGNGSPDNGGAGLGGGYRGDGGNITINGGTVTATGKYYGAGIGGGLSGDGGTISISGGTVLAKGGSSSAGIGGGNEGNGGTISISGGTVTAIGGSNPEDHYGGAGIGGGDHGAGGNVTIMGGSIKVTRGYNADGIGGGTAERGTGTLTNGRQAVSVRVLYDVVSATNPEEVTYDIPLVSGGEKISYRYTGKGHGNNDTSLYFYLPLGEFTTTDLTSSKNPLNVGGTVTFTATIETASGNPAFSGDVEFYDGDRLLGTAAVSGGTATYTTSSLTAARHPIKAKYSGLVNQCYGSYSELLTQRVVEEPILDVSAGDVNINSGGTYRITGETTQHAITVNTSDAVTAILDNVSIDFQASSYYRCPLDSGANVTLLLEGTNTLNCFSEGNTITYSPNQPAVKVEGTDKLTIDNDTGSTGSLSVTGGYYMPGIGGGCRMAPGDVTINGGTVSATGGEHGAGIGGGEAVAGGKVTIAGGRVTALGGYWGSGIGGGSQGAGGTVRISGGYVRATGGNNGAGIGGGHSGVGGSVTVANGTVTATGGVLGSGIGGGYRGAGGNVKITGGSIKASKGSGNAEDVGHGAYYSAPGTITNGFEDVALHVFADMVSAENPQNVTFDRPITSNGNSYIYRYTGKGHGGGDTNLYFYLPDTVSVGTPPESPVVGTPPASPGVVTLSDSKTGIEVSGNISEGAVLTVGDMTLGADAASKTIRQWMNDGHHVFLAGWDISLSGSFTGELTISLPVGVRYNGRKVTILHAKNDGTLGSYTATVKGGKAVFSVTSLSPFAVFAGENGYSPGTGDDSVSWIWWLLLGSSAAGIGGLAIFRRQTLSRNKPSAR